MASVRRRGQLLLIGGLALAISLVAIALVLNSAIYTHNLASRYDSPGDEIIAANGEAVESVGGHVRYVNDASAGSSYSSVVTDYRNGIPPIESEMAKEAAVNGRVVRLAAASNTQGVRIVDEESGGSTFYPRGNNLDEWTVAAESRVRAFRIRDASGLTDMSTTDAQSLLDNNLLSLSVTPAFVIEFDDGTDYQVALYEDTTIGGPTVMVHEEGTSVYQTCTGSAPVSVDFAAGTFDGLPCEPLGFIEGLSGTVDVRYYYGNKISGKYRLVVDRRIDDETGEPGPFTDVVDTLNYGEHCDVTDGPTYYGAGSSDYPRVSPAIYTVDVRTTYDSDRVTYQGTQRVAPKELGGVPQAPRVTSFDVDETDTDTAEDETDTHTADGKFTVTWTATDPNGDAVDTTIEVVEPDGQTKQFFSTGGSPATVDADDESGDYVLRLVVDDGSDDGAIDGNSRVVSQKHTDDGDGTGCPP